jgi:NADP-dependent 3-hydroxy acid dehydrogenase YdfG
MDRALPFGIHGVYTAFKRDFAPGKPMRPLQTDLVAGRIAVVTGAGSGIGAALCHELARRNYHVVAADRDIATANATCAAIQNARIDRATAARSNGTAVEVDAVVQRLAAVGSRATTTRVGATLDRQASIENRATPVCVDVTDAAAVEWLAADVWDRHGHIDLWINNAGIAIGGATDALSLADWRRVLDVNLAGVIHGVHAIYPRMIARRAGHIVNIASAAGLAPYPMALPYTTSKHAVVGLSQALRAEARAHGVRVSVACPGMIKTPIWERSEVRGQLANGRGKLLPRIAGAMTADACAAAIVRGVEANRGVIPVTTEARIAWLLNRASPALATRLSSQLAGFARRMAR